MIKICGLATTGIRQEVLVGMGHVKHLVRRQPQRVGVGVVYHTRSLARSAMDPWIVRPPSQHQTSKKAKTPRCVRPPFASLSPPPFAFEGSLFPFVCVALSPDLEPECWCVRANPPPRCWCSFIDSEMPGYCLRIADKQTFATATAPSWYIRRRGILGLTYPGSWSEKSRSCHGGGGLNAVTSLQRRTPVAGLPAGVVGSR